MWTWVATYWEISIMSLKWAQKRKGVKEGKRRERQRNKGGEFFLNVSSFHFKERFTWSCPTSSGPRRRRYEPSKEPVWFSGRRVQGTTSGVGLVASSLTDLSAYPISEATGASSSTWVPVLHTAGLEGIPWPWLQLGPSFLRFLCSSLQFFLSSLSVTLSSK